MISFWDLYAVVYDSLPKHFKPYKDLLQQIVDEVGEYSTTGMMLDAGCGTGNFSLALAEKGYNVVGVDSSERMLSRADGKKRKAGISNDELHKSDLEKRLEFPDHYFEGVISIHALYTMKDPEQVIKEYHRILRPNGQFVLSELRHPIGIIPIIKEARNRGGFREAVDVFFHLFVLGLFNMIISKRQGSGTYHYWSENELREILSRVGFKIMSVKETYTNNWDLLVTSIKI